MPKHNGHGTQVVTLAGRAAEAAQREAMMREAMQRAELEQVRFLRVNLMHAASRLLAALPEGSWHMPDQQRRCCDLAISLMKTMDEACNATAAPVPAAEEPVPSIVKES